MDSANSAPSLPLSRSQTSLRRGSFSPMKAIRSLSINSQTSHHSAASDSDPGNSQTRSRRTLRKNTFGSLRKANLSRNDSKSSAEDDAGRDSTSTRPTTPSLHGSRTASLYGDVGHVIKSGALQSEPSLLKTKKEHLVLTSSSLFKFKSRSAAQSQFPNISADGVKGLTPVDSHTSLKDLVTTTELQVSLEKVVSVFKDEGTRPSFGLEVWWSDSDTTRNFTSAQLDFRLPEERDDWLKQIRLAVKSRSKATGDERSALEIPPDLRLMLECKQQTSREEQVDIFPVVPRRPYYNAVGEAKKHWRDSSSFYLAFGKYSILLGQFSHNSKGLLEVNKTHPSLMRFGLVTLARVYMNMNDERFDLVFRLPLEEPKKIELSSRYYRNILAKLWRLDTYLKPAWPLWTRREVFFMDDEAQQVPLPNGEDYGGIRTTLEAFLEGFHCSPVEWTVKWKNVDYAPQFCLLNPKDQSQYSAHQLLAVFRAIRFNDFFKSLSFNNVDFSSLADTFDNTHRLESTIWLSRTGKRSLTRAEFDLVESSSVLFQELISILLGSESIKHIDLTNVLRSVPTLSSAASNNVTSTPPGVCELMPPMVLLWKSLQTRCNSIRLNGNAIGGTDAVELCRVLQNRPNFLRSFDVSDCNLDEGSLVYLWEGLHEQRFYLEDLDTSYNSGRVEASRIAYTLNEAAGLRRLNLAYSIRGDLEGPLFRPWTQSEPFEIWHLEELDLSGWKINFDTMCSLMKYLELDESKGLRRLTLNNCGISGEMATGLFCRLGSGRDLHLSLNGNPLETGSTDWIDLIEGNEAPQMLHLDMIQFQHESTFNRLLTALSHNNTIKLLSLVGTGPPDRVSSKTSQVLSKFFTMNDTLEFLDLSGYSGKLEDGHLGWGLSGALGGLRENTSLRQLRLKNHDMGAASDLSELCRVLANNRGLAMFDCRHNNFDDNQFGKIAEALTFNHQLISFPLSDTDRQYALCKEKQVFVKFQSKAPGKLGKAAERRLESSLSSLNGHWTSETERINDILMRNKNNPLNRLLELEAPYLEAWDDPDLPSWLVPKQVAQPKRAKRRASNASTFASSLGDMSPIAINFPDISFKPSHRESDAPRKTYVIEEEPTSDYERGMDASPDSYEG
ncbi:RNI-like protein [Xylariaceae sp. FL1272]|nr:RNI-like protein [Xylariaceae sp. FL1272]